MTEVDGDTERRILDAAHRVFVRRGMSGGRTQEIADEAGVNKALLHYYFGSKEKLARAVFREAAVQLMPGLFGILGSDAPLADKIRDVVRFELEFLREHPYLPGYVASEIHYHPELLRLVFGAGGVPPLDGLRAQLEAEAAAGRIRPIGVEQFMANLMGMLLFPFIFRPALEVVLGLEGARFEAFLDERVATLPDVILAGLRP